MPRTIELLLTDTVDPLGIVGDLVRVRSGYARNYLLPLGLAMPPSEEAIRNLAEKRALAEAERLRQQEHRVQMVEKLDGFDVHIERSCNDQGMLYGSVTQRDIAEALEAAGYPVRARDVRLASTIKRLDTYDVLVKFDSQLSATVKVWVIPDRELDADDERDDMDFDNEGNLIQKPRKSLRSEPQSEADSGDTHAG